MTVTVIINTRNSPKKTLLYVLTMDLVWDMLNQEAILINVVMFICTETDYVMMKLTIIVVLNIMLTISEKEVNVSNLVLC